uniref:EGF-like domain-containing protein n=1 Tax=Panagrellus redivivus TaxID=6233 RepID=A0A7E4WBA5_PANRE
MMASLCLFATLLAVCLIWDSSGKKDSGVFDSTLVFNFETQWEDLEPVERQELLSKTGKIAFFVRLYRAWTYTPNGQRGFVERFPDPPVRVPEEITRGCTKHLKDCIRTIYNSIQKRASFLFPLRDQTMTDFVFDEDRFRNLVGDSMFAYDVSVAYIMCFFVKSRISLMKALPFCGYGVTDGKKHVDCIRTIYNSIQKRASFLFPLRDQTMTDFVFDEDRFRNLVGDSMFAYDVSVAYIMCFFVKNRISFMKALPFCGYGVTDGKKHVWPSSAFRDAANNPFIDSPLDVIDDFELSSYADFGCAEESFCPDPCCRGSKNRTCFHDLCVPKKYRRDHEGGTFPSAKTRYPCRMDPLYNDNFWALTRNQWNISCDCPQPGHLFRFDTLQCVDVDECDALDDGPCESAFETCLNTVGSFECVCMTGYYRNPADGKCVPIQLPIASLTWSGMAHAPPKAVSKSPKRVNPLLTMLLFSIQTFISL